MGDLKARVLTGLIGLVALGIILYLGGLIAKIGICFMSCFLIFELSRALKKAGYRMNLPILYIASIIHFLTYLYDWPKFYALGFVAIIFTLYFILNDEIKLNDLTVNIGAIIYISYLFMPMIELVDTVYIFLVFIASFATDTFAYFVGSALGKHKLIPSVSPNKSVEGAIGGVVGCVIISILFMHLLNIAWDFRHILFFILVSIVGQFGDLFASKLKRQTGVKDFGKIMPGHGGFLDRFDSILFITPLIYILYKFS